MTRYIKTMAVGALLAIAATAHAGDNVVVVTAKGQKAFDADKVRIDLTDTGISVVGTSALGTTYAFDDVKMIMLQLNAASVQNVAANDNAQLTLTVAADGSEMRVNGWDAAQTVALNVFDTAGRAVLHQSGWNGQAVSIQSLPHGVYVLKVGTRTAKFRK